MACSSLPTPVAGGVRAYIPCGRRRRLRDDLLQQSACRLRGWAKAGLRLRERPGCGKPPTTAAVAAAGRAGGTSLLPPGSLRAAQRDALLGRPVHPGRRIRVSDAGRRRALDAARPYAHGAGRRDGTRGRSPSNGRSRPTRRSAASSARVSNTRRPSGHTASTSSPAASRPGRPYWYRFTAGGARSPVGRTATAPARGASPERLRLAVASCQQYEHGYYTAYQAMVADEPDLIVHLGDYIYELSWGDAARPPARHARVPLARRLSRALRTLQGRSRSCRRRTQACPWLLTWDDHEVENDYAADVSEEDDEPEWFLARRAAAYRACYEHQPLPRRALPYGPYLRMHTQRAFGDLANVLMLDDRQYRSPQACPKPGRRGSNRVERLRRAHRPRTHETRRAAGSVARGASRREQGPLEPARTGHGDGQHRRAARVRVRPTGPMAGAATRRRASVCSRLARRRRACATPSVSRATSTPSWPRG